jgi:phage-related protein
MGTMNYKAGCLISNSLLQFDFVIRSIKTNAKQADFTCGLGFDVFKIKIPKRVIYANFCRWGFKDSNCGYSGSDVACTKTFDECRRKNNLKNFGGFPGVQDTRIFI